MNRKLRRLIIDIIEDYFGKPLKYLDHQVEYDRFEEIVVFSWIVSEIERLLRNRKV